MFYKFRYETEFHPFLDRLPLHVRMKLDVTGVKLSLQDWLAFSIEERTAICHLPADQEEEKQAFKDYTNFLCRKYRGTPAQVVPPISPSLWETSNQVPNPILARAGDNRTAVSLEEWLRWTSHQRYALYKTAVSKSEPEKFFAVLDELRQRST
ncbi:MAG: nitrate reductase associated protein [Candidatus Binatia bacterium]